jgi:hypothetical protein
MFITGRPKKITDTRLLDLMYDDYINTTMTGQQVADKYRVSLSTLRRYVRLKRQQEDNTNDPEETNEIHI